METEILNNESGRKKSYIILIIIFSIFILFYSIMSMISPARKLSALKNEYGVKPDDKSEGDEWMGYDTIYLRLLKEKAFLQSRIAMAETDSIYLTINLTDSTANIEISGVIVHKTKIINMQASRILMKGNENLIYTMLSTPFTISREYSTIKKEPVMIKMAPKDTSEYKPDIMPDTSLTEPVNYILETTNGIKIYVYQEENYKFSDRLNLFTFSLKDRLRETWTSLKTIVTMKVPEYHPYIKLRLPRTDAKIIYRAIPYNGQIAVYR